MTRLTLYLAAGVVLATLPIAYDGLIGAILFNPIFQGIAVGYVSTMIKVYGVIAAIGVAGLVGGPVVLWAERRWPEVDSTTITLLWWLFCFFAVGITIHYLRV